MTALGIKLSSLNTITNAYASFNVNAPKMTNSKCRGGGGGSGGGGAAIVIICLCCCCIGAVVYFMFIRKKPAEVAEEKEPEPAPTP